MYSERTVAKLNEIANRYKPIISQSIQTVLNQYKNTGAGAASVQVEVVPGNANKSPEITIVFDDHLVFLNKQKMQWTRLPDMKNLVEWAKTKRSSEAEIKQLAWAVGWDKKKNDTWKAKPWRKRSLSKVLKEMNEMIIRGFDQAIEEDFSEATKV